MVKVAIAVPLSRLFDYLPAINLDSYPTGARVLVPFGRSQKVGVVAGVGPATIELSKLKKVRELLDTEPLLSTEIVGLIEWASSYYHCPVGEAFSVALPVLLRKPGAAQPVPPLS